MMRNRDGSEAVSRLALSALALSTLGLAACGPTAVDLDPRTVVDVQVRPASGQRLFCPGDKFQVEVVAKLNDGTSCSSTDRKRGCLKQEDAIIDPKQVRIEGSVGTRFGELETFVWAPPEDVLATADTGLTLKGWVERRVGPETQRSMVGEAELRPVYQCRMAGTYYDGEPGAPGPELHVAITTLSTPYYPSAALVRVESRGERAYFISPSVDQAITIASLGQRGPAGEQGRPGVKGEDGKSAASDAAPCTKGEDGRNGTDGGLGGPGGDGGPGGLIHITLDAAAADRLKGRVIAESAGGGAGPGGQGGYGGQGGIGGSGGPTASNCSDNKGADGKPGRQGAGGPAGRPGPAGPPPVVTTAARKTLFAEEMEIIARIEAAKGKAGQ